MARSPVHRYLIGLIFPGIIDKSPHGIRNLRLGISGSRFMLVRDLLTEKERKRRCY